ncbi:hypothetical protein [Paracidobacterium acidisoli]|uniref:Transporter n=1 Tax=Paracidobacterium acidisoli TaxID=2303751 RepID=A0A372IKR7_9BACT|nr:hypothetical protein [Paracidobacterium acidisoli]MBT9332866.1 hypothetical protein [Paracidobacterium acidisoli]
MRLLPGLFAALAAALLFPLHLHAQGCIVARSPEQVLPGIDQNGLPTSQGGYLQPGHVQVTIGERHQFSYQHYVGDAYQEYRAQQHTQVENRINIVTADLIYQWTPRISFELNAPFLFASRKSQSSPIEYQASGIGDTILAANVWLLNPKKNFRGNFQAGIGIMMPTGNDDVLNTTSSTSSAGVTTTTTAPVDYSIQPGNGGWGMDVQWQGFRAVGSHLIFYTDGDYIASQGDTNGVQRSSSTTTPLDNYVAPPISICLRPASPFPSTRSAASPSPSVRATKAFPRKTSFPTATTASAAPALPSPPVPAPNTLAAQISFLPASSRPFTATAR